MVAYVFQRPAEDLYHKAHRFVHRKSPVVEQKTQKLLRQKSFAVTQVFADVVYVGTLFGGTGKDRRRTEVLRHEGMYRILRLPHAVYETEVILPRTVVAYAQTVVVRPQLVIAAVGQHPASQSIHM